MSKKRIDLTGQKFGKLTVIKQTDDKIMSSGKHRSAWLCKCECGNEHIATTTDLRSGHVKSCGCSKGELMSLALSKDLTGKKFGRLIVIEQAEDYVSPSGHKHMWKCQCECGNTTKVVGSSLISGATKSCGCLQTEISKNEKYKDLTGQRFGRLVVLKKVDNYITPQGKQSSNWLCQCDCGNTITVVRNSLKSGATQSCGCYKREMLSLVNSVDLTGRRFGRLFVVGQSKNHISKEKILCWHCICDCGNECDVVSRNLLSGNTQSCGCYKKDKTFESHFKDLTGQRFGRLTVIKRAEDFIQQNGVHKTMWLCQCDCGNTINTQSHSLVSHRTISCGCSKSIGEYYVNTYLSSNNIDYYSQMKFNELIGIGGNPLSYDFYLPNYNILIECQGQQHENPINSLVEKNNLKYSKNTIAESVSMLKRMGITC